MDSGRKMMDDSVWDTNTNLAIRMVFGQIEDYQNTSPFSSKLHQQRREHHGTNGISNNKTIVNVNGGRINSGPGNAAITSKVLSTANILSLPYHHQPYYHHHRHHHQHHSASLRLDTTESEPPTAPSSVSPRPTSSCSSVPTPRLPSHLSFTSPSSSSTARTVIIRLMTHELVLRRLIIILLTVTYSWSKRTGRGR